jgi:methylisocitrate lyase
MTSRVNFRELIERDKILMAMGGYDALSAKLIEKVGGEVVYMSGSSVSSSTHGYPDVGLTTLTEMVTRARQMVNAVDIPVFCDADTGYGNPINVTRTVKEFESVGVAGIHIEDQKSPKKCGHFEKKSIIPTEEMVKKIQAAIDTRQDDNFLIIARTDARAVHGYDDAISRCKEYLNAGADVLFFEAPETKSEIKNVAEEFRYEVPLLANMTEGGKTPLLNADELENLGYDIILYPATGFKAAQKALKSVYLEILRTGTQRGALDNLTTWQERNELNGLDDIVAMEKKYAVD